MFNTNILKLFLTIVFALSPIHQSLACSVVTVSDSNKTVTGYTMEWVGNIGLPTNNSNKYMGGGIFLLPSGLHKKAILSGDLGMTWTSLYKSITLSTIGPSMAFQGINEKGLEVYTLGTANLMRDKKSGKDLSELDLVSYLLDTSKNTVEAVQALSQIKLGQLLLPCQIYIKDATGKVAIVDYFNQQRVHYPKPGESFVTNGWYDVEQYKWKHNIHDNFDDRYMTIGNEAKTPESVEGVLTKVGYNSLWQTMIEYTNTNNVKLTLKVNPYKTGALTKTLTFDLNDFFTSNFHQSNPQIVQYALFSDILEKQAFVPQPITKLIDGKIQYQNFLIIDQYRSALLGRNEEKLKDSTELLMNLLDTVLSEPVTNVPYAN